MDVDFLVLPALFFTLFATILGAVVLGRIQGSRNSAVKTNTNPPDHLSSSHVEAVTRGKEQGNKITNYSEELHSGLKRNDTREATMQTDMLARKSHQTIAGSLCEKQNDAHIDCPIVKRMSGEDKPLKYTPGMLRTSQLEKMMSKEELVEEQRVQREQLTAIFKLLKENQDTFGEMTEKDMEQQLKLYSI